MRILHLSTLYPPHVVGGAERSVSLLAEAQAAMGHKVAAACITPDGPKSETRNGVAVFRMAHHNDFWMEDWPRHTQAEREWAKFKQQFNTAIQQDFEAVIARFQPDVVNTHSMVDVSTRTWLAAARQDVPIVHTLRDYDLLCAASSMFRESGPCRGRHLKCRALTFAKGLHQHKVGAVTAVGSEVLRRHLAEGFFRDVPEGLQQVIWNAAEMEGVGPGYRRPPRPADRPFTFGYLGRISPEKGVDVLLRACATLPPTGWRLRVAGAAAGNMDEVRRMAEGLPVDFLGFSKPKDLLESVDVLVVPSLWAEPLGRSVLEAYRVGVPVIGSDTGGIAELVADPDWLTPPGDVAALGERMARVLTNGLDALPRATTFARVIGPTRSDVVAGRFLDLYRAVLRRTPRDAYPTRPKGRSSATSAAATAELR